MFKSKQKEYNNYIDIINQNDFKELDTMVQLSIYKQALKSAEDLLKFISQKCNCNCKKK